MDIFQFTKLPDLEACPLSERECIAGHRERLKRTATSPDMSGPAVMYLPLGGATPPGCPSIAESAVTGISQVCQNSYFRVSKDTLKFQNT